MSKYKNYVYEKGHDGFKVRNVKGVYKNSLTNEIVNGDDFSCIVINDSAEESYKMALEFYNQSKVDDTNASRIFVSAEWEKK